MPRSCNRVRGLPRRAVTLTEAVLFIAVALGLIVGGIVFYRQASLSARVNQQTRVLSAIVAEARALFQQHPTSVGASILSLSQILIASDAVPAEIIAPAPGPNLGLLRHEWDGEMVFSSAGAANDLMMITLIGLPVGACARLGYADADGSGPVTYGISSITFRDDVVPGAIQYGVPVSPALAASECSAYDANGNGLVRLSISVRSFP